MVKLKNYKKNFFSEEEMINITRDHEKPVNLISKQLHELWHRAVVTVDIEKHQRDIVGLKREK